MSKESIEMAKLVDYTTTISTIDCTECGNKDSTDNVDCFEDIEYFYKEGWRAKGNKCLCPTCCKIKE
jgi:hypothetical protein